MMNPEMPDMPGMPSMADTLEFLKKMWGAMGVPGGQPPQAAPMPGMAGMTIPGMVMPTLSVEEINKRISDLKTVESWLSLNMNMVRATIQALEVQAATLNVLGAMGQSVGATMKAAGMADTMNAAAPEDKEAEQPKTHPGTQPSAQDEQDAATLTAPLVNAAAWWNALQSQFQQAVSGAMASEPAASAKTSRKSAAAGKKTASKARTASKRTAGARKNGAR